MNDDDVLIDEMLSVPPRKTIEGVWVGRRRYDMITGLLRESRRVHANPGHPLDLANLLARIDKVLDERR